MEAIKLASSILISRRVGSSLVSVSEPQMDGDALQAVVLAAGRYRV